MKEAVLAIYYKKESKLHFETQGKFFYWNAKPVYLADMTVAKLWRNFNGYSIAKQLVKAFRQGKVRPQIIYRLRDKGVCYLTTLVTFEKKGVLMPYGGHEQFILPLKHWKAVNLRLDEPKNLPVMAVDNWIKATQGETTNGGSGWSAHNQSQMEMEDFTIPVEVKLKIRQKMGEEKFKRLFA